MKLLLCLETRISRDSVGEFQGSVGCLFWEGLCLHGLLQTDVNCESGLISLNSVLC